MKLKITSLSVAFRGGTELIPFASFSYFHGEIGSGKSTIAKLIDYCLGGELEMSPAMQREFVTASLTISMEGLVSVIERARESDQALVTWTTDSEQHQVMLPVRGSGGIRIPDTGVENVSDFMFYLCGQEPLRVLRSKKRFDSSLQRLSVRNLWWFSYLDQDGMDSDFYHLQPRADVWKQKASRNVMRLILGVHERRMAELEAELAEVGARRTAREGEAKALQRALSDASFATVDEFELQRSKLASRQSDLQASVAATRESVQSQRGHAAEALQMSGRELLSEEASISDAIEEVIESLAQNRAHLSEMQSLSLKFRHVAGARAVLGGVEFGNCPRCTQALPPREPEYCRVCAQPEPTPDSAADEVLATAEDLELRQRELRELMNARTAQLKRLNRQLGAIREGKRAVDAELDEVSRRYDSAYLSGALRMERESAAVSQELRLLDQLEALPQRVFSLLDDVAALREQEQSIFFRIKEERASLEDDKKNVDRLGEIFMDCLLRSDLEGFSRHDSVEIPANTLYPVVRDTVGGQEATTSFTTISSGGKKTLFKCCFALAIHRLDSELGRSLPSLLLIDSPMKNISERENVQQFLSFHELLYELATTELQDTQFILIDKEFTEPKDVKGLDLATRHMTISKRSEFPPLIPYYEGK